MVHFVLPVMTDMLFSLPLTKVDIHFGHVSDALSYLLDNIYIRFGTKLYRQIVGIPMDTNCVPLVADLFLYCYENEFMDSLNHDNQTNVIKAFRRLPVLILKAWSIPPRGGVLKYKMGMYVPSYVKKVGAFRAERTVKVVPLELIELGKRVHSEKVGAFRANRTEKVGAFRANKTKKGVFKRTSSKIYNKRDDFDFDIVNFPFLDGDVPRCASYGVYISQLIRFARICNHVDFNARNKCLTAKLLQQGHRYHKLRKTLFKFYRRHYELISKFNVGLMPLLLSGHLLGK